MQLDPTTIIFALLAIFVVWRLKSVLGTRVDIERRPPATGTGGVKDQSTGPGNVVRLPGAAERAPPAPPPRSGVDASRYASTDRGRAGLAEIIAADPTFDPARFESGAKVAYDMIVRGFAEGDKATLSNLLSPEVYSGFASAIDQRQQAGQLASTKLVSIDEADIVEGSAKAGMAQITVRFSTKMISATRGKDGEVVQGDPDLVISTDELWTFARQIGSPDPTWRLIATESDHKS